MLQGAYWIKNIPEFPLPLVLIIIAVHPPCLCHRSSSSSPPDPLVIIIASPSHYAAAFCHRHCQRSSSCLCSLESTPHLSYLLLSLALLVVAAASPSCCCHHLSSLMSLLAVLVVIIALPHLLPRTTANPVACMLTAVSGVGDSGFISGDTYRSILCLILCVWEW